MQISKEEALKTFEKVKSMTLRKKDEGTMRLLHDIFPRVKAHKRRV